MKNLWRIGSGAAVGAVFGAGFFISDLLGAFLSIGFLFDPKWETCVLLGIAAIMAVAVGGCVGGAVSGVVAWLAWPRWRLKPAHVRAAWLTFVVLVGVFAYFVRVGRRHVPERSKLAKQTLADPPPILWVVVDTLRADTFYGEALDFPLAPATRAFARNSLIFSDAESTAGWTIPSLAALLTGIHNTTTDASAGFLPGWAPSIARRLSAAGYATHALVDNVIIEPRNGFAAGFDTFFQRSGYRFAFSLPTFRLLPTPVREAIRGTLRTSYYGGEKLTDAAIRTLQNASSQVFMFVHYMDPHAPYHAHPELGEVADENDSDAVNYYYFRDILRADEPTQPSPGQLVWLKRRYENEVRALDADLGRLLQAWSDRFGDRGMVVLTADHGEEFLDHGHLGHGITLNREMVHVPLIIRFPKHVLLKTGVIDQPVSLVDVVKTTGDVLDLDLGLDGGVEVQGVSWLPWLKGEASVLTRPLVSGHSRNGRRVQRLREGNWVYINNMFYSDRPRFAELYNLENDPKEQNNLVSKEREKRSEMTKMLGVQIRSLTAAAGVDDSSDATANEESLRALGYIE